MEIRYIIARIVGKLSNPRLIRGSVIEKTAKVYSGAQVVESTIGSYTYVAYDCTIISADIGKFCSIAKDSYIGGASHPINWVSTSPVFHSGKNAVGMNFSHHEFNPFIKTTIGNDVWIGGGCKIKAGLSIGDGAIIGLGSVVTKDVGPYEIWAGNPAKLIRRRFSGEIIERLVEMKWWDYSFEKLTDESQCFNNIEYFLEKR